MLVQAASHCFAHHENDGEEDHDSPGFIRPIAGMLKTNKSIKELSLAGNNLNAEAARIFSQDIHDNGALAKMTIGESKTPATLELGMTEGNFSGAGLGAGGAIILAAWIEHK